MNMSVNGHETAQEISKFLYEKTGKRYEPHSTGLIGQIAAAHMELIRENFKGREVYIDGEYVK